MKMDSEVNSSVDENSDNVLELAIDFAVRRRYPPGLSKDKKRAVRRREEEERQLFELIKEKYS